MKRKSLYDAEILDEVLNRLARLSATQKPRWGRMDAAQMLLHCDKILQIATGEISLPKTNFAVRCIGILTKIEMRIFGNGIPPNMPTFDCVKVDSECEFILSKNNFIRTLERFLAVSEAKKLPAYHELFGKMTDADWGFLEYKHIDHHFKQFGL